MLNSNGKFVIDFMNSKKAINQMVSNEVLLKGNIEFKIQKTLDSGQIIKTIEFTDKGKEFNFEERVQALMLDDFQNLIKEPDLQITHVFGDYQLNAFNEYNSDRLILVGQKP
jgi:hypothetical protein